MSRGLWRNTEVAIKQLLKSDLTEKELEEFRSESEVKTLNIYFVLETWI